MSQRALAGSESATPGRFRRAMRVSPYSYVAANPSARSDTGHALVDVRFGSDGVVLTVTLSEDTEHSPSRVTEIQDRVRRWLDLDADATAIDAHLSQDPSLAQRVQAIAGLRVPGTADPFETAIRAIIGQQVSVAGARTVAGRLVLALGAPLQIPDPEITRLFPGPAEILAAPDDLFAMPEARRLTIRRFAEAVLHAAVDLEVRSDNPVAEIYARLLAIKGIGPWTASYIAMRALGDRDVFLPTDLGVIRSMERQVAPIDPERWRPYRSYALHHLWLA